MAAPCGVLYHHGCQRVGAPFHTRLREQAGQAFPSMEYVPNFMCEACTGRAVLGRELGENEEDVTILLLERMRMIDIANRWAKGTLTRYTYAIRRIRNFEKQFNVSILRTTKLVAPPVSPAIPLQWAHQHYTLHTTKSGKNKGDRISANGARVLRSAASHFADLDLQVSCPGKVFQDNGRTVMVEHVTPSSEFSYCLMTKGMNKRLGTASTPPTALTGKCIQFIDQHFTKQWDETNCPRLRHEIATAALVNVLAWTSWARSREIFDLRRADVDIILPSQGPTRGLPENIGAVLLTLQESTKGDQARQCDIPVAYVCGSGLSPGMWLQRVEACNAILCPNNVFLFQDPSGRRWDSAYFRTKFLIPILDLCRLDGEAILTPYDGSPGNTLAAKFYSMGCYRRGGRSAVSHRRKASFRIATQAEAYEHGRWKVMGKNEAMPVHYTEWTLEERLCITLFCM